MDKKFLIVVLVLLIASSIVFAAVANIPMPGGSTTITTEAGKSIVYYLKTINFNLVSDSQSTPASGAFCPIGGTPQELKNATAEHAKCVSESEKAKVSSSVAGAVATATGTKSVYKLTTVKWSNVLSNQTAAIIFPKITVNNESHSLKVVLNSRNGWGLRFAEVYDNGTQVACNSGFWNSTWNGLWMADSLVLGWFEGGDTCVHSVGGFNILKLSIEGSDMQTATLVSPIIPDNCPATIDHTAVPAPSANNEKRVTC